MKKLLLILSILTLVFVLSSCRGGASSKDGVVAANKEVDSIVTKNCSACHGATDPALETYQGKFTKDKLLDIIKNGKGYNMPGGLLSESDAEKVAEWLASK